MTINEDLIRVFGEPEIEKWLLAYLNGDNYIDELYAETNKEEGRNLRLIQGKIALENYILKYYNNTKSLELREAMNKVVFKVGQEFANKDSNMLSSAFLRKENIDTFYVGKNKNAIMGTLKYFDKTSLDVYKRFRQRERLKSNEKKLLMRYFSYERDCDRDGKLYKAQVDYMKYLFQDYSSSFSSIYEKEFVANFTVSRYFMYEKDIPRQDVIVADLGSDTKRGNNGLNIISINSRDVFDNKLLFLKTVNHESRHTEQRADSYHTRNKKSYDMAKKDLLSKYLSSEDFNFYKTNYRFEDIEKDAEEVGLSRTRAMLPGLVDNDMLLKEMDNNITSIQREEGNRRGYAFAYIKDKNGEVYLPEEFEFKNLRHIMKNHPEMIRKYPVLQMLFQEDGKIRSFNNILTSHISSNDDTRVTYDFLRVGIKQGKLSDIPMESLSDMEKRDAFDKIIGVLEEEILKITKAYESYEASIRIEDNLYIMTMKNHINICKQLFDCVEKNFELIDRLEKENNGVINNCSISKVKRLTEQYVNIGKKYGSIDLVKNEVNELEEIMKDVYTEVGEVKCNGKV